MTGDQDRSGARATLLHESARSRVTRLSLPAGGVICKEPLGPDADRRLRHEVAFLSRLSGAAGVAQLANAPARPGAVLLADVGGVSLASTAMPWKAAEVVDLGLGLARAVAGMHQRGVMHTDISPANIVVTGSPPVPYLIDFALATTLVQTRPGLAPTEIVGTLPYLAPELSGRTGRAVDQRADLYALGATLYELATGKPPFSAGDPLQLVHDHLARVPVSPAEVNPAVPAALSEIIMHLLEKEPDNRYQTADGLVHDLARVRDGAAEPLRVGDRDFPLRLRPPSRIIGRDTEIAALSAAFAASQTGRCPGVLVSGAPGVGKTSLIEELRPVVTASGGWFVSGKFDQYRRDLEFDGVHQAFRALGRLLLALPEEELAGARTKILRGLGHSAGLATAVTPELASLLGVPPDLGDPLTAEVRAQRNSLEILRAVASRQRPVVFVVDDLQWAGRTPLGFVDLVLSGQETIDGLLLVCAHREVDTAHPLAALISRWQREKAPMAHLRLAALPASSLAALVAHMLRVEVDEVTDLTDALRRRTGGNPYETVELLNTWRREGVLRPADKGWEWDAAVLRRAAGPVDLPDLLAGRVAAMPPRTRSLLEVMACLGGQVELGLLRAATDLSAHVVGERLVPALEDGLLLMDGGQEAVRFRHDRVWEGALAYLPPQRLHASRMRLARRLAARPELSAVAAQQYLQVIDAVTDPGERRHVVELLRRAAEQARLVSNYAVVDQLFSAAVRLADPADSALLIELHTGRLTALYGLGRLDEADEAYRAVDKLATDPVQRTEATLVQVSSLANRSRSGEAIELGIDVLRRLGVTMPEPERIEVEVDRTLDTLYQWLDQTTEAGDLARPEITDPALLATAALINRMIPPAFQADPAVTMVWLVLQAVRMWAEHGPGRTLVGPVAHLPLATTRRRQDYRTGYRLMRRVLAVSEARGYEPDTAQARFLYAFAAGHWFTPLEECVVQARRAWDGLLQGGDLQNACWTANVLVYALFDCAPSLDAYLPEVEAALAIARRTGNDHSAELTRPYLWLVSTLGGTQVDRPAAHLDQPDGNPTVASNVHITRAVAALLMDDPAELDRHSAAAMALLPFIENLYVSVTAHLTRALALAGQLRAAAAGTAEHASLGAELDAIVGWWAARSADAPTNFQHLLRLVEAERAWAVGDFRGAVSAFDAAQRDASVRQRPWHRALVTERAARFYLAHGVEHIGHALLADACRAYLDWGAAAKVNQLRQAHPGLAVADPARPFPAPGSMRDATTHRASIMTGAIDLLGILAASQALSSETSLHGLRHRVVEVLSAMTGATAVNLLLWDAHSNTWRMPAPASETATISLDEAGQRRLVPLSAVRYVERTREPLVVADALADDRFARDSYFDGYGCCSLLAVPILNRATPQALLLLENRLIRGAFSADRLDGVMLIAGQLTVSLDNALVYASLEGKVAERTRQLAIANERLQQLSVTDPLTGLANRRRFEEVLTTEWDRAIWAGSSLALAMIDVDHFKRYNDHYGHPAGDECLHRVATLLRRHSPVGHLVARYGGEEFAVIMPGTDIDAACEIAERLRAAVCGLAVPHHMVADRVVTASIGVAAAVPSPGTTADRLVERADVELYRAKRAGRNQVKAAG